MKLFFFIFEIELNSNVIGDLAKCFKYYVIVKIW